MLLPGRGLNVDVAVKPSSHRDQHDNGAGDVITTNIVTRRTRRYFKIAKSFGTLNGFVEESISGQKVVKAFVREAEEIERFEATNVVRDVGTKVKYIQA